MVATLAYVISSHPCFLSRLSFSDRAPTPPTRTVASSLEPTMHHAKYVFSKAHDRRKESTIHIGQTKGGNVKPVGANELGWFTRVGLSRYA